MNQRFRITRSMQADQPNPALSLEECRDYFASQPGFAYSDTLTVNGPESRMSIEGDFFMWQQGDKLIPFRLYAGDLYVAPPDEEVVNRMIAVATDLRADIVEG